MHKIINLFRNNFVWQASLLIFATVVSYGLLINNYNLWMDEIYSVLMAKDNFSDMWGLLYNEDSKPPLYYLYLKVILKIFPHQYEIWAAHFSSAVLLIAAQIFAATVVKKDYGEKVSLWLIILLAIIPYSLWLALEVRTYMLSSLLLLISAVYGLRLLNTPHYSDFIKFGIFSLLALYSHYYCALWLMFFYIGLLYCLIKTGKFKKSGIRLILTALTVGIFFIPWLYVPLHSGHNISRYWYVTLDFVRFSWQFFTNPMQPEIFQSIFFIATTFATSVFSFILLLGMFDLKKNQRRQQFWLVFGSFAATYILLLVLSYTIRPMVTARYLKIYALILYFAAAIVISEHKNIQKAFGVVALIGFIFTWVDIHATAFDKEYQNAVSDIRQYIPKSTPLLVFDNSNLFCEYYLPEYTCLLITNGVGEILRKPNVLKNISAYNTSTDNGIFGISIFNKVDSVTNCRIYNSTYRFDQSVKLCYYRNEVAKDLIEKSLKSLSYHRANKS